MTDDQETIETLREVYGDNVEKLDLLVGLMAEKKIKGFAISETAFFIFVIMASRYTLYQLTCTNPNYMNLSIIISNIDLIMRLRGQTGGWMLIVSSQAISMRRRTQRGDSNG